MYQQYLDSRFRNLSRKKAGLIILSLCLDLTALGILAYVDWRIAVAVFLLIWSKAVEDRMKRM